MRQAPAVEVRQAPGKMHAAWCHAGQVAGKGKGMQVGLMAVETGPATVVDVEREMQELTREVQEGKHMLAYKHTYRGTQRK